MPTSGHLEDYINGLTEETSPDTTNDMLLIRDATDGSMKKIAPDNLGVPATITVEEDGETPVTGVDTIIFDGATVTDNTDGSVTVGITGGGGGTIYTSAYASPPSSPANGDWWLPSDSIGQVFARVSGAWVARGPLFPFTEPPSSGWSWDNQGTASVTTTNGGIVMRAPHLASYQARVYYRTAPSVPYVITAYIEPLVMPKNYLSLGLCWRESSSGKLVTAGNGFSVSPNIQVIRWTNSTTSTTAYQTVAGHNVPPRWLRIADNNTSRIFSISADGVNWVTIHTIGRTDHMTADQVGIYIVPNNEATPNFDTVLTLLSWSAT